MYEQDNQLNQHSEEDTHDAVPASPDSSSESEAVETPPAAAAEEAGGHTGPASAGTVAPEPVRLETPQPATSSGSPLPASPTRAVTTPRARLDTPARDPAPAQTGPLELLVDCGDQRLWLLRGGAELRSWPVSTSSYGLGSTAGSNKTPLGRHRVAEKYGAGAPLGTIFRARQNTGQVARVYTDATDVEEDLVLTRILWLEGLEPGSNRGPGVDSKARYIYIHGTNEEGLIGRPASHGCVRMRNRDVVELFDLVPVGTGVTVRR